jgi:type II secretory pathway pseudopilin PulG
MMHKKEFGFTLMETMVALVVLLAVSAVVMTGMMQMMKTEGTITNRTEMHTSVRAATELLQQEIGQAGKISLPTPPPNGWLMTTAVLIPPAANLPWSQAVTFSNDTNNLPVLFEGEWVTVDTGVNKETVQLTCAAGPGKCPGLANNWLASFYYNHNPAVAPVPFRLPGSFATGIIPPAAGVMPAPPPGYAGYPMFPAGYPYANAPGQGSTGTVLKLFGDVNDDGNMVYVEYTCVPGTPAAPGFLYRNQVPYTAAVLPPVDPSMIVLTGVLPNPPDAAGAAVPCFTYQLQTKDGVNAAANDMTFVTDVAVTLTVQTPNQDPQTHQFQQETKALLNVSPRNIYQAYEFATLDYLNRIQPTPVSIKGILLPNNP